MREDGIVEKPRRTGVFYTHHVSKSSFEWAGGRDALPESPSGRGISGCVSESVYFFWSARESLLYIFIGYFRV